MKNRLLLLFLPAVLAMPAVAQTARTFTVNLTADGSAKMEAYLPESPTGRAVIDLPGGYQHLSMQNEGHDWAQWFNGQGYAGSGAAKAIILAGHGEGYLVAPSASCQGGEKVAEVASAILTADACLGDEHPRASP
ncbi:MAG: hypothetical protein IJT98_07350 [Prevotella sp.]|nr:hypothetical protein [Prevotella sp.]